MEHEAPSSDRSISELDPDTHGVLRRKVCREVDLQRLTSWRNASGGRSLQPPVTSVTAETSPDSRASDSILRLRSDGTARAVANRNVPRPAILEVRSSREADVPRRESLAFVSANGPSTIDVGPSPKSSTVACRRSPRHSPPATRRSQAGSPGLLGNRAIGSGPMFSSSAPFLLTMSTRSPMMSPASL